MLVLYYLEVMYDLDQSVALNGSELEEMLISGMLT